MRASIRYARPEDIDRLEALEELCFSVPWTRPILERQLASEAGVYVVAEDENGDILGYGGMSYVLDECYIFNVAVDPTHRGMGLGETLVSRLIDEARALDMSFISLEVRVGNSPAIALYEKHGFRTVGIRKNYYEAPKEDALLMTVFLKGEESL